MVTNFFKIAWRNLRNNKVYSLLNILGLATGMAVALVIGLWVYYQLSYDRFLPGYQHVYKVKNKYHNDDGIEVGDATCLPLADVLRKEIPGVKYVARTDWMGRHSLVTGEKKLYQRGVIADEDFLKIFPFPLLKGNANVAMKDPYSIVLCESTAKALFGNDDPLTKTIRIDNSHDLKVTGVLQDVPANSTMQFTYIVPLSYALQNYGSIKPNINNWRDKSFQTFVALEPNANYAQIASKVKQIEKNHNPEDYKLWQMETLLHPIQDWHLHNEYENGAPTGGFISYVKMFSIIGILVLLIACINFVNLSTARSEKRAREVGIRKAVGSQRTPLIFQFLFESLLLTGIAFALALLMVQGALPAFNELTKTSLHIPWQNGYFWLLMAAYVVFTGLLAGSRPAFYLSSFQPVKVLKGSIQAGSHAALPRKILVVLQFSCSIALIISTIIVYNQVQHAKNRPVGYDANRLMMCDVSTEVNNNYQAIKNEMLQSGMVSSVTKSSNPVTEIWSNQRVDDWQGKRPGESLGLATIAVSDGDYFKTMGMEIVAGRNFTGYMKSDSLNVILNEAAVKRMRYKEALDQVITWHDNPQKVRVIGVVKDALMASPYLPAEPTIFIFVPDWASTLTWRLTPTANTSSAIKKLTAIFNKYNPYYPFQYNFVDESYATKFNLEILVGKLAGLFAALAIFISCLGLFGLAAYMAEQRTKEIGIRKVLGASISQVWLLLSKEFILLVVISCAIASPVAFYFLHNWLQRYPYRIGIGPSVFILAGVMAIGITIITISFQAIKAATANPVKSLRSE